MSQLAFLLRAKGRVLLPSLDRGARLAELVHSLWLCATSRGSPTEVYTEAYSGPAGTCLPRTLNYMHKDLAAVTNGCGDLRAEWKREYVEACVAQERARASHVGVERSHSGEPSLRLQPVIELYDKPQSEQ